MKKFFNKVKEIAKKTWKFIKNAYNAIIELPQDKLLHILAISMVTMAFTLIFKWLGHGLESCFISFIIGFFFGLGKGAYNEPKKKTHEGYSLLADFVTAAVIAVYSCALMF